MEFLFDIERTSASEIHEVLGFADADFSMVQVLPYLRKATKQMLKYIGDSNYDLAVADFKAETDSEFLTLVRYGIALGAFRELAPLLDVSHTTNGRVFRSEDHTKAAFEWMLDRSDAAMERSYYSAINEIFDFILGNIDYTMPKVLVEIKNLYVSSLDIFEEYLQIDNSYALFLNLIPSLKLAEKRLIKPRVGLVDVYANEDMLDIARNICVYYAMKDGLRKNSVQLFPRGVLKESTGKQKHVLAKQFDIEASVLHYDELCAGLQLELESAIAKTKNVKAKASKINFEPGDGFVTM